MCRLGEVNFAFRWKKSFCLKFLNTSALLRSSVFRKQPRQKVMAPPKVASQESSHKPWASFTLFSKGNFILAHTMSAAGERYNSEKNKKKSSESEEERRSNVATAALDAEPEGC